MAITSNRPTVATPQPLPPVALRIVYRAGGKPGQIDHPGLDARPVYSPEELDEALASGWVKHPSEVGQDAHDAPEPEKPRRTRRQDAE